MAKINGISIPGVTAEKDWRGNIIGASVNFKRCSDEIKAFFSGLGITTEKSPYDQKFVKKIKDQENMPGKKITVSELWN
ncbi:MAG: hypothetical protein EOM76_02610 [Sphingobacteriia bacterium]|jgi:hypothetical protein|nr:hypothetical protein [Paludibacteraceae bacterium]NCA79069.1 hypothetical protein [Sphingobacteriia bacterium]